MLKDKFKDYRKDFIMDSFYKNQWEKEGLRPMADQFRDAFVGHALMIGAFLDGYTADAAQTTLHSLDANTMRDYAVSDSICKFGTLSRSLASSDMRADVQKTILSEVGLARNLGTENSIAGSGRGLDNNSRMFVFGTTFCDPFDNNNGLGKICSSTASRDVEYNRDIDFTRTIDDRNTLNINLTDNKLSRDEDAVISLGHMLYGHRQDTKRLTIAKLRQKGNDDLYAMIRSVTARRAAAQNTYDTIAAMKAAGGGASKTYMTAALANLGMSSSESSKYIEGAYLGSPLVSPFDDKVSPSYYAQMDILTKHLYQSPGFYTNLMDTKANVKRTSTAMAAISLAQDRDIFRSVARSEMLMALLLQMEADVQSEETKKKFDTDIMQ